MPTKAKYYDLVVLGGGPAGIVAAATALTLGKSVAMVDNRRKLGGAGINTGTLPSKTLRETALALAAVRSRQLYGVDLSLRRTATVADFMRHERQVKASFNTMIARQLAAHRADVFQGLGAFVDANTIAVSPTNAKGARRRGSPRPSPRLLRGRCVMIATGSAPFHPSTFPFASRHVFDSDSILQLKRLPRTLAVIGAGVIGSEYACTFAALGTRVHLVDGRDALLPFIDREVSQALANAMERAGIVFHWKQRAESCTRKKSGVTLSLSSGKSLSVDAVLVAAGRTSNTASLNLAAAGVSVGERGLVHVDASYRTNVPHIYATGDVIGFPALASTSMEQARRAIRHAFGAHVDRKLSPLLPSGIYTIPETSMVGETEEALQKKGVDYVVGRASYCDDARGAIIGDRDGFLKLLYRRKDMKLLGVHVIGEHATELVHVGMIAMIAKATAGMFNEACFNFPTLGSLYKSATLDATLRAAGVKAFLSKPGKWRGTLSTRRARSSAK